MSQERRRWGTFFALGVGLAVLTSLLPAPFLAVMEPEISLADYRALSALGGRVDAAKLEAALAQLDPYGQLKPYVSIEDGEVLVRAEAQGSTLVRLPLAAPRARRLSRPRRVLLDPGHMGGAWSHIERRHFDFGAPALREGDLNYGTALLIAEKLEAHGIDVRISRPPPPNAPFSAGVPRSYDPEREARRWLSETRYEQGLPPFLVDWGAPLLQGVLWQARQRYAEDQPFELWNRHDLRARAALAAEFDANVTLSLHYNTSPSGSNGIVVFVPGNFLPGELATAEQRYWALRRAIEGRLEQTIALGQALGYALQRHLGLEVLGASDADQAAIVPQRLGVNEAAGVYARNLAMLRRTPGVALLLEGPCMNHPLEYDWLRRDDVSIGGSRYPPRALEYAEAVTSTLLALPP